MGKQTVNKSEENNVSEENRTYLLKNKHWSRKADDSSQSIVCENEGCLNVLMLYAAVQKQKVHSPRQKYSLVSYYFANIGLTLLSEAFVFNSN